MGDCDKDGNFVDDIHCGVSEPNLPFMTSSNTPNVDIKDKHLTRDIIMKIINDAKAMWEE